MEPTVKQFGDRKPEFLREGRRATVSQRYSIHVGPVLLSFEQPQDRRFLTNLAFVPTMLYIRRVHSIMS